MTNNGSILADSIAHITHIAAFDLLMKSRFNNMQLDQLLVYIIDTVDASAIPYLAQQFDVLGYKGFRLANTDADKRNIIKRAIELHRYKGTLWAIREALVSIGYGDAEITEHVGEHWANFRVTIDLGEKSLGDAEVQDIVKMINEYKNARSTLVDVSYIISISGEKITLSDSETDGQAIEDEDEVSAGGNVLHNGLVVRNGTNNYGPDTDLLIIEIQ
ncbi:phage tail protein I [Arachidicoccus terrestris]|uniref:phage tail protein I n=1 Tax=Arachidicoccus terrestris TaxID=2875539 RepID=UPI001CC735AC|nr:phage tail protein I [Arachidicoccus terrestris]UAY56273.1 phage tail protein I [Arachidicoccus terrestris]